MRLPRDPAHPNVSVTPRARTYPFTAAATWLLTVFLVLLPKGGVKVGTVPLTWGYLLLAFTLPVLSVVRFTSLPLRFSWRALAAFASLVPFQMLFLYSYRQNGVLVPGLAISTFTCFFVLPFAFLLIYPPFLHRIDGVRLDRLFRFCIFTAALYGIVLFVTYPLTGQLFQIKFLTVNADDYGLIEATKHINRGVFLKLISTYNNGNLYGVATLIFVPLYDALEPRAWRRNLLKLALLLTLSRTVWFGLIVEQALSFIGLGFKFAGTFPRLRLGPALRRGIFILLTIVAILVALSLISRDVSFLFDKELGGRSDSFYQSFHNVSWMPTVPVWGFLEIVYTSALADYGIFGLLSIVLVFTFPIVLLLTQPRMAQSSLRMAALKGLVLYMILCCLDGAINLIPVMAFYWFAYTVFLHGWPGGLDIEPDPASNRHRLSTPVTGLYMTTRSYRSAQNTVSSLQVLKRVDRSST